MQRSLMYHGSYGMSTLPAQLPATLDVHLRSLLLSMLVLHFTGDS